MIGFAQVSILAPNVGHATGKFGVDKCSEHSHDSAHDPCAQNQNRRVYLPGDHVGVNENTGTDNSSHEHQGASSRCGFHDGRMSLVHWRESNTVWTVCLDVILISLW